MLHLINKIPLKSGYVIPRCRYGDKMMKMRTPSRSVTAESKNELKRRATMKWLNSIVIEQKLCPFAPPVRKAPKLRVAISEADNHDEVVREVEKEAHLLVGASALNSSLSGKSSAADSSDENFPPPETTLIVLDDTKCTSIADFRDLVRLSWQVQEEAINGNGYGKLLQQVLFHPLATHDTYTATEDEDAADYTIRSPYPVIHLLREEDVMEAVTSGYKDLEGLPSRNKKKMRANGVALCSERLEMCKH